MGTSCPGPTTYVFLHQSHNAISALNALLTATYACLNLNVYKEQLLQPC